MFRYIILLIAIFCVFCNCCLITNCPRGGKRSHLHRDSNIKQCVSCGPAHTGQCFGPNICCGPFGCLIGTPETVKCQREGFFHEPEPCIAGVSYCRKNSGRCASDNICCTQESCYMDKSCSLDEKQMRAQDIQLESIYNMLPFNQIDYANEINTM